MRWARAVHHVEALAASCATTAGGPAFFLPVRQLWAFGPLLGEPRDLDVVTVALAVDLPVDDVPWLGEPQGAGHWGHAVRLPQNPVVPFWRSVHAPVWNHEIQRPLLVWDSERGVDEAVLAALRDGRGESLRPAPVTAEALERRLEDELAVSLRALRRATGTYEDRRWSPGKLTPHADALWRASAGYLDVADAVTEMRGGR